MLSLLCSNYSAPQSSATLGEEESPCRKTPTASYPPRNVLCAADKPAKAESSVELAACKALGNSRGSTELKRLFADALEG